MKKIYKILLSVSIVMILVAGLALWALSKRTTEINSTQKAEKLEETSEDGQDVSNTGTDAPEVELQEGKKPVYSEGDWKAINEKDFTYDIKVTTFNVGQFYHGTTNLDVYGAQKVHEGILPEYVLNGYKQWQAWIADMESDIYALQEFNPIFYVNSKENVVQKSKDVFAEKFKTLATCTGTTNNGAIEVYMGLAAQSESKFTLTDITSGYLSGKDEAIQRPYLKGYTTVKGKKIAVFSVHLQPMNFGGPEARRDAIYELIRLMNKEEYAIAMGDFNGMTEIVTPMKEAGFHMANMGDFGNFNTYEYSTTSYIDNIFTTSNIDIEFVECETKFQAASDHYPLSAYLTIKDEAHSAIGEVQVGEDGFIDGWYKP